MTSILWHKPIELTHSDWDSYPPNVELTDEPGIYFFSRIFGSGDYEPFYIGKSIKIRSRLKQYFYSTGPHEERIRNVARGGLDPYSDVQLRNGPRYFHFGYIAPASGLNMGNALDFAERALIQYGTIVDWALINNQHAGPAAFRSFDMNGRRYGLLPEKLVAHK